MKYFKVAAALFVCLVVTSGIGGVRRAEGAEALKPRRMAVLPWKINAASDLGFISEAMVEMLSSRIGSAGPFEMVRPGPVKDGVDDRVAAEVGKKLKLDYVLYGSLTVLGESVSVDSILFDVKSGSSSTFYAKGRGLDSVVSMADKLSADVVMALTVVNPTALAPGGGAAKSLPPLLEGVEGVTGVTGAKEAGAGLPAAPPSGGAFIIKAKDGKPDFWKSASLKGSFVAIVAADLDRDGVKELFLVGKSGITVAIIKDSKLKVLKRLRGPSGVQYIGALALDSDGDGVEELYLSGVRALSAYSSVVEFTDDSYRTTATGIRWLLRSVTLSGTARLVGQGFRESDGFHGPLRVLKRVGAKLVDSGPFELKLPKGVDLYRFAYFGPGLEGFGRDGEPKLVVLDKRGHLRVYRQEGGVWSQYWKSAEYYGGTLNYIESDEAGSGDTRLAAVAGRFFVADLDSDDRVELIIRRNVTSGIGRHIARPGSFAKGSVMAIEWDGEFITEKWRTKEVSGYIADFLIDDLDSDGTPEVVMVVVEKRSTLSGAAKSYILSYELSL